MDFRLYLHPLLFLRIVLPFIPIFYLSLPTIIERQSSSRSSMKSYFSYFISYYIIIWHQIFFYNKKIVI